MDAVTVLALVVVILALAVVVAALVARRLYALLRAADDALRRKDSEKRSQSTRYGQITEQFAPFLTNWPWDPKRFKFLGDPIDGIQFTDDGIVFVEIKTATSRLSAVQRQVRDHVLAGRVHWHEQRLS